jgi:hypothetical protein
MSMFDIAAFSNATFDQPNDTVMVPCPEGEFVGVIEKPEIRPWKQKDGDKSGLALDYMVAIDDPKVTEVTGRKPTRVRGGVMLDLTDAGGLDFGKGKNVGLGKLREAVGLNQAGQPFSFNMLAGQMIRAKISTRVDGDRMFDEVKAVSKP